MHIPKSSQHSLAVIGAVHRGASEHFRFESQKKDWMIFYTVARGALASFET